MSNLMYVRLRAALLATSTGHRDVALALLGPCLGEAKRDGNGPLVGAILTAIRRVKALPTAA